MNKLSIGQKYATVFAVTLFLFLLAFIYIAFTVKGSMNVSKDVQKKDSESLEIMEMSSTFKEKYIALTDYITNPAENGTKEYKLQSDKFLASANKVKNQFATDEERKLFNAIMMANSQMDNQFYTSVVPAVQQYQNNGDQIDVVQQVSVENRAALLRNFNVEKLNELKDMLSKERTTLTNKMNAISSSILIVMLITIIVAFIISACLIFLVSKNISSKLKKAVFLCKELAKGNLQADRMDYRGKDEIGEIAVAMNELADSLQQSIQQIMHSSEQVNQLSLNLRANAESSTAANDHITLSIMEVASGSDHQLGSANETQSVVKEVSNGLTEITHKIEEAVDLASNTADKVIQGTHFVKNVTRQMETISQKTINLSTAIKTLNDKSSQINQIVALITAISEETNLLALNASIEAARAGEHGRGFGVVAGEVRKLAEQSAAAAGNIRSILEYISKETTNASKVMKESSLAVTEGGEIVKNVGAIFNEILNSTTAVKEQNEAVRNSISEANESMETMLRCADEITHITTQSAESVEKVAATTEQQNAVMQELLASSSELADMSEALKKSFEKFHI
ncbi:MAG: methyl-accepting chemotaxis protein [Bacillota bacterium]|nr:methyl-accepting chemotaxis protein [Bacillota bacterium]